MRFVGWLEVIERFRGKRVAIVGSAPSVLDNEPGAIDSRDVVVRINNYKLAPGTGVRADVHYSFYGTSVRHTATKLKQDGVTFCMCKCPNSKPIDSAWHEAMGKPEGVDFRYIYRNRRDFWFCDTFVPSDEHFLAGFSRLGRHIPTTGFSAIQDVLACDPAEIFLTGFDFFSSGLHNVDEPWRAGRVDDPIGHRPMLELEWLKSEGSEKFVFDKALRALLAEERGTA